MCGIAGAVTGSPPIEAASVVRMRDTMTHRGPDDAGLWRSKRDEVFLANRRLAILDLSSDGHMPMVDASGRVVITFNGEIYNYLELRAELESRYRFRSKTDTEVLLAAYSVWGYECLKRLNGMFAFAVWDSRERVLFVGRDRFGEKPFYYHFDPVRGLFLFASEAKALLASGLVDSAPDQFEVYRYLAFHQVDSGGRTMFDGVRSLPAAHAAVYSQPSGTLKVWRYWDIDPQARLTMATDERYAERFLELLDDSVRIRLRADVAVGSSLSGGLDSSTVVQLAARQLRGMRQVTFSARFHDPRFDEGRYIDCVARESGAENHVVYPDPARLPDEIGALTWHQDFPFGSASIYAQWNVMRLAKQTGVIVLLDGQGGDEILAGYHPFFGAIFGDLLRGGRWVAAARAIHAYAREHGVANLKSVLPLLLEASWRYRLKRRVVPDGISEEFRRRWHSEAELPTDGRRRFPDILRNELYAALTQTVLPSLLRYADRNSMAFSREVRLPYLDHRLVEFCFAIPDDQKLCGGTTKVVMRNAIGGIVPEMIRTRKDKLGFAPPQADWLLGPLRPWAEDTLHSTAFRQREWIDAQNVDKSWRRFLSGQDRSHTTIWHWLSLEEWMKVFAEAQNRQPVAPTAASFVS